MINYIYEVHDECGKLRVFFSKAEAERFAGYELKIVKVKESKYKEPGIDWNNFEPAPF